VRVEVRSGAETLVAEGRLLEAQWEVRFFHWETDPREDAAAFAALLAGEPVARAQRPALDLPWRSGAPDGVRADRFATLATTTLDLPAGRYRIRTVSDDGVRVFVDGACVIENWTHHAPTEDHADVTLSDGPHAIRVEHFELDGWAHLSFAIEPAE
jgi:hypothetical protein